tara:strand:- start:965 stop:1195 length:231 start_codon:yes stop_codon:yes gene_type:complete
MQKGDEMTTVRVMVPAVHQGFTDQVPGSLLNYSELNDSNRRRCGNFPNWGSANRGVKHANVLSAQCFTEFFPSKQL